MYSVQLNCAKSPELAFRAYYNCTKYIYMLLAEHFVGYKCTNCNYNFLLLSFCVRALPRPGGKTESSVLSAYSTHFRPASTITLQPFPHLFRSAAYSQLIAPPVQQQGCGAAGQQHDQHIAGNRQPVDSVVNICRPDPGDRGHTQQVGVLLKRIYR